MTALNVIVQRDAAHLITDAAALDENGVLIDIAAKLFIFPALNAAFAVAGRAHPARVRAIGDAHPCRTLAELKDLARRVVQILTTENAAEKGCRRHQSAVRLAAIAWNPETDRPEAWVVASGGSGPEGTEDGKLYVGHVGWLSPPPPSMADYESRWDHLDPAEDGRRLLEEQRATRHGWSFSATPCHGVGGYGERATVSRSGLTWATIVEWPEDRVGQVISPAR